MSWICNVCKLVIEPLDEEGKCVDGCTPPVKKEKKKKVKKK